MHLKSDIFHFITPQVNLIFDWALNWPWGTGALVIRGTKCNVYTYLYKLIILDLNTTLYLGSLVFGSHNWRHMWEGHLEFVLAALCMEEKWKTLGEMRLSSMVIERVIRKNLWVLSMEIIL